MNTFKKIILPVMLIVPCVMFAQDQATSASVSALKEISFTLDGNIIPLEDYIKLLLSRNETVLSASYDLFMTDSDYLKFQKKYATYLNGEVKYSAAQYPDALATETGTSADTATASVSATKVFSSGTTLSAGLTHTYQDVGGYNTGSAVIDYTLNQPVAFVSLQQELLKNAFGKSDRNTEQMKRNSGEMKRAAAELTLSNVVTQGIVDYWSYVMGKSAYENAKMKYDETVRVRNIVRSNVSLGLAEAFDLSYYNALVASAEADMASKEQSYRDSARAIFRALNIDGDEKKLGAVTLVMTQVKYSEEDYLALAYKQRADYLSAKLGYENAKLDRANYENSEAPSLVASVGASAMGVDSSVSTAYSDLAGVKYPTLEAGLKMSYPLGDTEQEANLRDSRYKAEQARLGYEKMQKDVRDDIKSGIETVATAYTVMKSVERSQNEIETYYAQLLVNLRRGRINSTTIKTALDARADSRQRALEARINYNINLIKIELAANNLLIGFGIKPKGDIK